MFGKISGMFSKPKSLAPNNESITIPPIMVSDYVGTANTLSEVRGVGNGPIITKDLLSLFNDKSTNKHQLFLDGVIGKNNGSFPVTNPVKDNVYFYAVERKYYKCNTSVSGVVNAPDTNFSEFSLSNFKGGVSGINITGAATGSGKLDEATGIMTVNTVVNWSGITGKPSTLPNPNGLVIKLNGTAQTTYTGSSPVELNITAASIGAQIAGNYAAGDHNHDGVYQPKGSYALSDHNHNGIYAEVSHNHSGVYAPVSHNHTASNITAMTGYVKAESVAAIAVTDSLNVAIGKLEKALDGKAPTGNYAVVGHNHNDSYNTKAEITELLAGKLGATANAVSASKLATARTISLSGAVSGSNTFDGSGNMNISVSLNGLDASKITSGTISVDRLPKTALSEFIAVKNAEARLALTKAEVQNGDTVKETDTKRMYLVIDDTKLNTEEGYQEYTTVVDWSTITGKPTQFQPVSHVHTWDQINGRPSTLPNPNGLTISLNGKAQTAYTGASAVSFDITPASIGAQPAGSYASSSHNHNDVYAAISHTHTIGQIGALTGYSKATTVSAISASDTILSAIGKLEKALDSKQASGNYSVVGHTHSEYQAKGDYALASHNHNGVYAPVNHDHTASNITSLTGYVKGSTASAIGETDTLLAALGKLEKSLDGKQAAGSYALSSHNHDSVYQPKGSYAASNHNHDTQYAAKSHGHAWGDLSGIPSSFTPSAHNQASSTITTMTGYTKATAVAAIAATDSLNVAIGKLEKALDGKQAAGSYAASNHNHSGVYANASHSHAWGDISGKPSTFTPSGHNQAANTITAMTGYSKPSSTGAIATSDTLNAAIGKLEKALDGKQAAGSYAAASHNHNGVYQPAGSYAAASHNHSGVYAPVSHGNHVPATQTANNKIFLRCDNTWHTITPAEIGAQPAGSYAAANHTHTGYAAASHTHPYLPTSGGTISGALTVTGQILSNADVVAYSDARMKTNVVKIESALDKVSKISGYTYDMQGIEFGGQRQAGVLAQELKEVLPEAVVTDDNGYYAVRYTNIIPLLIEALKEEKSKRESLEERLAKIERMLDIK